MNPLESYINQATKGLWGKKKLEVREELTAHILERAHKHEIAGIPHEIAITRAIEELGDAKTIRAGMIGVHTMPNVFKISGFLTVIAAGAIALLSVSSAQITGTIRFPNSQCLEVSTLTIELKFTTRNLPNFDCEYAFWLNLPSLRTKLTSLNVKFSMGESIRDQDDTYYTWLLKFPQGMTATIRQPATAKFMNEKFVFSPDYINSQDFIEGLQQLSVPFTMSGWDNPTLRVGDLRFGLGSSQSVIRGSDWYRKVLNQEIRKWLGSDSYPKILPDAPSYMEERAAKLQNPVHYRNYKHTIQTQLPTNQIVVVLSRSIDFEQEWDVPRTRAYISTIGKDGVLEYPSEAKTLRFMNQASDLRPTQKDGAGDVIILKFTHNLTRGQKTFEIIPSSKLSK